MLVRAQFCDGVPPVEEAQVMLGDVRRGVPLMCFVFSCCGVLDIVLAKAAAVQLLRSLPRRTPRGAQREVPAV